jgi:hypothetical protein
MSLVEEVIVVVMFLILGLVLGKLDPSRQGPILSGKKKEGAHGGDQDYSYRPTRGRESRPRTEYQGQYQRVQGHDLDVVATFMVVKLCQKTNV